MCRKLRPKMVQFVERCPVIGLIKETFTLFYSFRLGPNKFETSLY